MDDANVMLHIRMPNAARIVNGMLSANYTTFETTRIPECWIEPSLSHDVLILPTDSAKQAWVASGIPEERIRLCPLGVDPERFHPGVEPLDMGEKNGRRVLEYRTRFLNVSAFISAPRKNLLGLLRVWIKATDANDDAILILKLIGYSHRWWWPDKFSRALKGIENKIGKTMKQAAPVLFYHQALPDTEMPSLYRVATHYWSMSYGEGWDLPMTEAGAVGLHLIAPKHSAYTTYLDDSVAQMIPTRQIRADFNGKRGLGRLFKGSHWWEPDEQVAEDLIRRAVKTAGNGAPTANERLSKNFTWGHAAKRLIRILEELHQRHGKMF
jgi:glycosyltransferase involved in cell wall biosynthesis